MSGTEDYVGSNYINHPVSLTAVEAPTEEEQFRPFGPTDEPVDTSGLFGSIGGVSGAVTGDSLFMVEEEPAQQLRFREHIVGVLTTMTRALVMVAILHHLWLSFFFPRDHEHLWTARNPWGITSTKDGSALTAGPTVRSLAGCSNVPVNVLVDSGAYRYFDC